jgi:hypothetical protein
MISSSSLILAPPFSTLLSVFIFLGLKQIADMLARKIYLTNEKVVNFLFFLTFLAISTSILFVLSWLLGINIFMLKILAYLLSIFGIIKLYQTLKNIRFNTIIEEYFICQSIIVRVSYVISFLILIGLFLMSVSPPTDGDSLGYHLGSPLEYLRNLSIQPRYDWLEYRLSGLGEIINMFGLAAGTDCLGAVFQFSGLVLLLEALKLYVPTQSRHLFYLLLLATPLLIFLVPNQKPQLFPAAIIVIALVYLHFNRDKLTNLIVFLISSSLFFTMASKYSFYIPCFVIFIAMLFHILKAENKIQKIGLILLAYFIVLFPIQLYKFVYYENPVSPILASFFNEPEYVSRFAAMLKTYYDSKFVFPLNFLLPDSLGRFTSAIGVGSIIVIIGALLQIKQNRFLVFTTFIIALLYYFNGARCSRYYFEVYVLLAFVFAQLPLGKITKWIEKALLLQMTAVLVVTSFGVYSLFPGALTQQLREKVLDKNADYYTSLKWANSVLPNDAVIFASFRVGYLSERKFFQEDIIRYSDFNDKNESEYVKEMVRKAKITHVITSYPISEKLTKNMGIKNYELIVPPKSFYHGVRNPFNRGKPFELAIYKIGI